MIHPGARVHATAHVDAGATLAEGVEVGPFCYVAGDVAIGAGTRLIAHVTVLGPTTIGAGNIFYPGCVLGAEPQDNSFRGEPTSLEIGDGNRIREGVTINRGTTKGGGKTVVGNDNLLMACSHVAHDCVVGSRIIMANNVLLAGHVHIGDGVVLNGAAAAHHFVRIGRLAYVGGLSRVVHDVPPFLKTEGSPSRARALNAVGLRRNGFAPAAIDSLEAAFRQLFRSSRPLLSALRDVPDTGGEVTELLEFLRAASSSPTGRYLEKFRKDATAPAAPARPHA
jgi:UDP-N-acetylglucosamine acyltransferase